MNNPGFTTSNEYAIMLQNQIIMVDQVIKQAAEWMASSQYLQFAAGQERESAKIRRICSIFLKILSPAISIFSVVIFYSVYKPTGTATQNDIIGLIMMGVIFVGLWLIPFGVKKHIKKAEEYEKRAQKDFNAANMLIRRYANCLSIIPQRYWYPMATNFLVEVFQTGRANTIPMALDKLEEQIHRWNMEYAMRQTLANQIMQTESLRRIEIGTTASVIADVANLLF